MEYVDTAAGLDTMPVEILQIIANNMALKDVARLREVNQSLANSVSQLKLDAGMVDDTKDTSAWPFLKTVPVTFVRSVDDIKAINKDKTGIRLSISLQTKIKTGPLVLDVNRRREVGDYRDRIYKQSSLEPAKEVLREIERRGTAIKRVTWTHQSFPHSDLEKLRFVKALTLINGSGIEHLIGRERWNTRGLSLDHTDVRSVAGFSRLKMLVATYCPYLRIITDCPKLRSIEVIRCMTLTIISHCPELVTIDARSCPGFRFIEGLPKLKTLIVDRYSPFIKDPPPGVKVIAA